MKFWEWALITTLGTGAIVLLVSPIFKTGARHNVTGWDFIVSHTKFSPHATDYIPQEELSKPLTAAEKKQIMSLIKRGG